MEFLFGLFTGYLLNFGALGIIIILSLLAESGDNHKTAVFLGLVSATIVKFMYSIPIETMLMWSLVYFGIGSMWAIWRYKRWVSKRVEYITSLAVKGRSYHINDLKFTNNIHFILTWVIIWPISMTENLVGDFITLIKNAIITFFSGIFNSIFNDAKRQIEDSIEADSKTTKEDFKSALK